MAGLVLPDADAGHDFVACAPVLVAPLQHGGARAAHVLPDVGLVAPLPEAGLVAPLPEAGLVAPLPEAERLAPPPEAERVAPRPEVERVALPDADAGAGLVVLPDEGSGHHVSQPVYLLCSAASPAHQDNSKTCLTRSVSRALIHCQLYIVCLTDTRLAVQRFEKKQCCGKKCHDAFMADGGLERQLNDLRALMRTMSRTEQNNKIFQILSMLRKDSSFAI